MIISGSSFLGRSIVCKWILPSKNLPYPVFVIWSSVAALLGSVLLVFLAYFLSHLMGRAVVDDGPDHGVSLIDVFGYLVLAPVFETFVLIFLLRFLSGFGLRVSQVCLLSGLCWGVLHALLIPLSFFGVSWNFFIFSYAYCVWAKGSRKKAFFAAFLPHVFVNVFAVSMMSFS